MPAFAFTEVDLFSFDAPAHAPAAATDDGFDAFQSAPAAPVPSMPAPSQPDPFGNFSGPSMPAQSQQFDAFGTSNNATGNMAAMNNMFGNMGMQQQPVMNGGGMMAMQQQPMAPAMAPVTVAPPANDDDFGDFEGACPQKQAVQSSDPMSRLIQLDSLTKNAKKEKEDKLNEPIVATPAAANYVNQQQQIHQVYKVQNVAASFQGIDGLNKPTNYGVKVPVSTRQPGKPIMGSESSDTSELISMLSPQIMTQQVPQQRPQNAAMTNQMAMQQQMMLQQQMMMQQQNGMMNPHMQQNNMMNPQMQPNNMMNPQMATNPMMNSQQMGMMNPNMQMQGGMNSMQGTGSMQGTSGMQGMGGTGQVGGNMMGGQPMGGQMSGQPMGGQMHGQMGGQPMGGWP